MTKVRYGRIVNFATVATPLNLEGEAIYASSKAAVESLTRVLSKELAPFNITINAVGPTPVETDLIRGVAEDKIEALLQQQAINRLGESESGAHLSSPQKSTQFETVQYFLLIQFKHLHWHPIVGHSQRSRKKYLSVFWIPAYERMTWETNFLSFLRSLSSTPIGE